MRVWVTSALLIAACSNPPDPTIPPRDQIGPPRPAATDCFPPYSIFAQDWFEMADMDLGVSCRVFVEQDECVLGIYRDCTDPAAASRQWVGAIDSNGMQDMLEFSIFEGMGAVVGRPPKCCRGELFRPTAGQAYDGAWARLDCALTSCDNTSDRAHVGVYFERADPSATAFGAPAGQGSIEEGVTIRDVAYLSGRRELWAVATTAIVVRPIDGAPTTLPIGLTQGGHLAVADHEGTAYVSDGTMVHRIDTVARAVSGTVDIGRRVELLEYSSSGVLVGAENGDDMQLSLRGAGDLSVVIAEQPIDDLVGLVEVLEGTPFTAYAGAVRGGDLVILTSTLTVSDRISLEKPARRIFAADGLAVGYLAECSDLSNAKHCYFERDLAGPDTTRRVGIPNIGDLSDAVYDEARDRVLFVGEEGGLAVLDRRDWRPLLQQQSAAMPGDRVARDRTTGDVFVLSTNAATFQRIQPN